MRGAGGSPVERRQHPTAASFFRASDLAAVLPPRSAFTSKHNGVQGRPECHPGALGWQQHPRG